MAKASLGWLLRIGAVAVGLAVLVPAGRADDKKADQPVDDALKDELLKLNRVTEDDAQLAKLRELVKDKEAGKRKVAAAARMMKAADKEKPPFNFGASLILAKAAHYLKDYDAAKVFYDHCAAAATKIDSAEKMIQAYEGLMDMYWDGKKFQKVVDLVEKVVEIMGPEEFDRVKPFFLERLVQAKAKLGQTAEALRIVEGLVQLDEGGWYFLKLKGWVQHEAGKNDQAIETYNEALDRLETNKKMKGPAKDREKDTIRYILSSLYVDAKDIKKAAEQLQGLIKRHPDNPTYKNDLGFVWCDHDMNLDEAEKLIREALDLDKERQEKAKKEGKIDEVKETAAYLDSMGWVLFKQKKYKEALPYLKKAAADEDEGTHLEIWDHLGDCYMAMGQKKEAIDAWQKGLEMDDLSARDVDRRKEVAIKLKKEGVEPKVAPKKGPKVFD
jgi:tetratricopeptide (TPR) repeat protein